MTVKFVALKALKKTRSNDYGNIEKCKKQVSNDEINKNKLSVEDVFVVWSCKTLQNCKALLANNLPDDNSYYEFTYNGDKDETYMDKYEKVSNRVIK